jgi:post-segregation antitoxin (ccd killing protein)
MTKLELSIEVSDQLARDARDAGLLAPEALTEMLQAGVRQKAFERIRTARSKPSAERPMTLREIQEIVESVRKRRD